MRYSIIIFTMAFLSGLFSCEGKKEKDIVFDKFKTQLENHGMRIDSVDKDGRICISKGEFTLKVSLDNVRRNFKRDKDESHITQLVQTLLSYSSGIPESWQEAKESVFISLFPNETDFQEFKHTKISDEFSMGYVYSDPASLQWIHEDDFAKWGITDAELEDQANRNADKLMEQSHIIVETIENKKLGMIKTEHDELTAALLFAPAMKEKVKADFGYPFYAVIPVRDFCYIFSESDFEFFSGRLGNVVVEEYKKSAYAITTEVLKFSDKGVGSVGRYPVE